MSLDFKCKDKILELCGLVCAVLFSFLNDYFLNFYLDSISKRIKIEQKNYKRLLKIVNLSFLLFTSYIFVLSSLIHIFINW